MSQSEEVPLPPWGDAIAGAVGAVLANAAVYPLDIVKTRIQTQIKKPTYAAVASETNDKKDIEKGSATAETVPHHDEHHDIYHDTVDAVRKIIGKEGLAGLYGGMFGSLLGVASTNFAYFYWYSTVRHFFQKRNRSSHLTALQELAVGAVAGALAQLFTIPVAVVTTRQQTQPAAHRKGLWETAEEIIHEDGISGLWRGFKASLVLVSNPSITYGAYQRFHEFFFAKKPHLGAWEAFVLGAASKSIATLTTQPLIVSKVTLQSKPRPGNPKFKGFIEVLKYIFEHEGIRGLFKGLGPQLGKGLLVQGILMMSKERIEVLFIALFALMRKLKSQKLAQAAAKAAQLAALKK